MLVDPPALELAVEHVGDCLSTPTRNATASSATAPLGEWLALVAAQEQDAMRHLHRAVEPVVRRVVNRIVFDAYLADEVVGDCLWQVWREASRFDATRGSVRSWVAIIARSRALDALRRRKALALHEEALDDQGEPSRAACSETPVERLQTLQRDRRLSAALSRIDPIQRQLLLLSFMGGLSHEQVADHCGLSLGTVKSHIRRGLTQMRVHCVRAGLRP